MTQEQWESVENHFAALMEAPPQDRDHLLASIPDPTVRDEVASLWRNLDTGTSVDAVVQSAAGLIADVDLSDEAPIGDRRIGPYRLIRRLGHGGQGTVFEAVRDDGAFAQRVAIKVVNWEIDGTAARERFRQERQILAGIEHPYVARLLDGGETEKGDPYLVLEFVDGLPLGQATGDWPTTKKLALFLKVAEAVAFAHTKAIVHRDLKPGNIMVTRDGVPKLLDFGIAKLLDDASPRTITSMRALTPDYASPEQVKGEPISPASDIYSLGVVLYQLLTNRLPYKVSTTNPVQIQQMICETAPAAPQISKDLDNILLTALRKDPDRRYANVREFAEDIERSMSNRPVRARPDTITYRATMFVRRNRRPVVAAAILAMLAGGAFGLYQWRHRGESRFANTKIVKVLVGGESPWGTLSPDGRYVAYGLPNARGPSGLFLRSVAGNQATRLVPPSPNGYLPLSFSHDMKYLYHVDRKPVTGIGYTFYRIPVGGGEPKMLPFHGNGMAQSPDGSTLVILREETRNGARFGVVALSDADGSNERIVLERKAAVPIRGMSWSPDGRELYFIEGTRDARGVSLQMYAFQVSRGSVRQVMELGRKAVNSFIVLKGGEGFLLNAMDPEVSVFQIWHLSLAGTWRPITRDLNEYYGLWLTAKGDQFLTNRLERFSVLWTSNRDDPSSARQLTGGDQRFDQPVWMGNGKIAALLSGAGASRLFTLDEDGTQHQLLPDLPGWDNEPIVCPGAPELIFTRRLNGVTNLWKVRPDGSGLQQLTSGVADQNVYCNAGGMIEYDATVDAKRVTMNIPAKGGQARRVAVPLANRVLSPDETMLVGIDTDPKTRERVTVVRNRLSSAVVVTIPHEMRAFAWSPDSKGLAYRYPADEIWYQPIAGGPPKQLVSQARDAIFDISWSPDGRRLVFTRARFVGDMVLIQDLR